MDGGDLGPVAWKLDGELFCPRCAPKEADDEIYAIELVEGTRCVTCAAVWDRGAWWGKSALQLMYEAMQEGEGDVWDDKEKKLVHVDEETAKKTDQDIVFRVGEEVTIKGLRFAIDQIRGTRMTLRPIGRRLSPSEPGTVG